MRRADYKCRSMNIRRYFGGQRTAIYFEGDGFTKSSV